MIALAKEAIIKPATISKFLFFFDESCVVSVFMAFVIEPAGSTKARQASINYLLFLASANASTNSLVVYTWLEIIR